MRKLIFLVAVAPRRRCGLEQQIRFCSSKDGVRIACGMTGDGPPLVRAANWLSHVQFDLESPVWRHWIEEFSRFHRYVRYDERGCGLSDWIVDDFSFDAWVHDLEAGVRSVGLERFVLVGLSRGGAVGDCVPRPASGTSQASRVIRYLCRRVGPGPPRRSPPGLARPA